MARVLWMLLTLLLLTGAAAAQCRDPGTVSVPEGFNVSSEDLMKESDRSIAWFVIGTVDATLNSAIVGGDVKCIHQLVICTEGRMAEDIAAEFRRMVIAVPANRRQPASQVVFNIAFGECFKSFQKQSPAPA